MKKKIIVSIAISFSMVLVYVGIKKYLQADRPAISLHTEQNENIVIQSVKSCTDNDDCASGNCEADVCMPCIKNCSGMLCDNDGQCCDSGNCINNECSNGGTGCACSNNDDCLSANCYDDYCATCLAPSMLCSDSQQCCDNTSCIDGSCQTCGGYDSCACSENSECNNGNCYGGICQHCIGKGEACSDNGECCNSDCRDGFCDGSTNMVISHATSYSMIAEEPIIGGAEQVTELFENPEVAEDATEAGEDVVETTDEVLPELGAATEGAADAGTISVGGEVAIDAAVMAAPK